MDSFRFFSIYWFALLPVAAAAFWLAYRPRNRPAAIFSSIADLKSLPVTAAQRIKRVLPYLQGFGALLLIGALARPQQGKSESVQNREGLAIEMTIDVSGSMQALDFQLNDESIDRIGAVKHVVTEFVEGKGKLPGRPNDAIGLVAFGGFADSKCPLTLDHGALLDMVKSLQIPKPVWDKHGNVLNLQSLQEESQTAIGDGMTLALDRLGMIEAKSKIVILLTDGTNDAGVVEPRDAALVAKALGIKVYCICVGRNGPVPFPVEDAFGNRVLQSQSFPIDEELLRYIADTTGGKYWHATNLESLADVYAEIDKLEKSKVENLTYTEYREFFPYLALPGLVLIFSISMLNATRFRSLP